MKSNMEETKECNIERDEVVIKPQKVSMWSSVRGDRLHILVLMFLYTLQGIPYGLKESIPLILARKGVSSSEQAIFSISRYPFSMKVFKFS